MKRACGVLLPVSSLPTAYGIGGFSKEADAFIDLLARAGQSYWQVLPLGPVGKGDSPYQSYSTFAGNPYFIALDRLQDDGLLTAAECREAEEVAEAAEKAAKQAAEDTTESAAEQAAEAAEAETEHAAEDAESTEAEPANAAMYVDYEHVRKMHGAALQKAYDHFRQREKPDDYDDFLRRTAEWLPDYALFMAILEAEEDRPWNTWPDPLKKRDAAALDAFREAHADEIGFIYFQQYEFDRQWNDLKKNAHSRGIRIIGDIPIYVSMDGADAWSEPKLFQMDENFVPTAVAGCPPDVFSADGQLWGNPLYDWTYQKKTGYAWWIRRLARMQELYDVVRLDHFRGFHDYWSVPYGAPTAASGHWEEGPGLDLFRAAKKQLGKLEVIAEDLGLLSDGVVKMVKKSGYPGMKIIEFAFDSDNDNPYLPFCYDKNCVVYTGTHDNDTAAGWLQAIDRKTRQHLNRYVGHRVHDPKDLIRLAMASTADLCIIPIQDWLGLGSEARINTPGTCGDNWRWRLLPGQFTEKTADEMAEMADTYARSGKPAKG